jgi:hypothetical protein
VKTTKQQLTNIIKEEFQKFLQEESETPEDEDKLRLLRITTTLAELAQGAKQDELGAEVVAILDDALTKLDDLIK